MEQTTNGLGEEHKNIANRVFKHKESDVLYIQRVPKKTKEMFIQYSEEFCGDYGMALKELIDFTFIFGPQLEAVHQAISEFNDRLSALESSPQDNKPFRKNL